MKYLGMILIAPLVWFLLFLVVEPLLRLLPSLEPVTDKDMSDMTGMVSFFITLALLGICVMVF